MLANKLLGASKAAAAATYIEDVFSTYLYTGNGAGKTISNGIAIGTDYPYGWSELHLTGDTLTDTSRFSRTVTANAVTVSTTTKKFGTGSLEFNGSTYLTAGKAFLNDALASWELQCWVYWNSTGSSSDMGMICSQYSGSTSGRMLFGSQSGDLVYRVNGATVYLTTTVTTGQWYHIVLNWDGTTHRLFKDGVLVSSSTTAPDVQTSQITEIGGNSDLTAYDLDGYIDDLTITNNQPVYTADFTVPTSASLLDTVGAAGSGGLVWIKGRSGATDHALYDTVRGATFDLVSNSNAAQTTQTTGLTSFNSNGFTIGALAKLNTNAATYVSWAFREQDKFFDVRTVSHTNGAQTVVDFSNLGTLGMVIYRDTGTSNWFVWHRSLTGTNKLLLNATDAQASYTVYSVSGTTVTIASAATTGTKLIYAFAHNAGGFGASGTDNVISCGTYLGSNHRLKEVVTLGYEPQWVLIKNITTAAQRWVMVDNMRGMADTGSQAWLFANSSVIEATTAADNVVAAPTGFYFNGPESDINEAGSTFVYIAIRRGPMKVPTSGASVFAPSITTQNWVANTVLSNAGFAADTLIEKARTSNLSLSTFDRLRGASLLETASTSAQVGAYLNWNAAQNYAVGATTYSSGSLSFVWYYFRRAPGFFDVVCYTGNGSTQTVSHNLGVAPELMIVKKRQVSAIGWFVYSAALGANARIILNLTDAVFTPATAWNSTSPTSTVFSLGVGTEVNASADTFVAYLFASCPGVSKVGSYTGTGTTLTIDCGFTAGARFVMIKRTDSTGDWFVWDTARGIISGNDPYLRTNTTGAEITNTDYIDPANSGFEISSTAPVEINASGGTYIYLAIA
jgi:hypothetical protein